MSGKGNHCPSGSAGGTTVKPSMCSKLDRGEGYTSYVRGFTSIEMRLIFGKTRSDPKYLLDSLLYLAGN